MEKYNPNKFKNGIPCRIPEATWNEMKPEQKALYSDTPDTLKEIPGDAMEIKMPEDVIKLDSNEIERLKGVIEEQKKEIADLENARADLIEENNSLRSQIQPEGEEPHEKPQSKFNPYELEVDDLKAWLKENDIKFDNRVKDIKKLQELIP